VQERPFEEELGPVERGDGAARVAERPDGQQLAGVVPLVERLVGVDALVALQPDELPPEHGGQHPGDLGLADAGLALQQQRRSSASATCTAVANPRSAT
jgi:hypothetical protein